MSVMSVSGVFLADRLTVAFDPVTLERTEAEQRQGVKIHR